jgi:hypothetical protein
MDSFFGEENKKQIKREQTLRQIEGAKKAAEEAKQRAKDKLKDEQQIEQLVRNSDPILASAKAAAVLAFIPIKEERERIQKENEHLIQVKRTIMLQQQIQEQLRREDRQQQIIDAEIEERKRQQDTERVRQQLYDDLFGSFGGGKRKSKKNKSKNRRRRSGRSGRSRSKKYKKQY